MTFMDSSYVLLRSRCLDVLTSWPVPEFFAKVAAYFGGFSLRSGDVTDQALLRTPRVCSCTFSPFNPLPSLPLPSLSLACHVIPVLLFPFHLPTFLYFISIGRRSLNPVEQRWHLWTARTCFCEVAGLVVFTSWWCTLLLYVITQLSGPDRAVGPLCVCLSGLPCGRNFYPHTHTHGDPHGDPHTMGIPIPTTEPRVAVGTEFLSPYPPNTYTHSRPGVCIITFAEMIFET